MRSGALWSTAWIARVADAYRSDRQRRTSIAWRSIPTDLGPIFIGDHVDGCRFWIRPNLWGRSVLGYEWPGRGDRELAALESPPAAMRRAEMLAREGGPFGGPTSATHSTNDLPRWSPIEAPGEGLVISFGMGYELRLRQLGEDLHVLTEVSPFGILAICGVGTLADLAFAACRYYLMGDPWSIEPLMAGFFHLHDGERAVPFMESRVPGILGVAVVGGIEHLLVVGESEAMALVRLDDADGPRVIASGRVEELAGLDLARLPREPAASQVRCSPDEAIAAIERLGEALGPARPRLRGLVEASQKEPGTATCRVIVVAIAGALAGGQRARVTEKTEALMVWLGEHGSMPVLPTDGSRRRALAWLADHCDFVRREGPRGHRWTIDFEQLGEE